MNTNFLISKTLLTLILTAIPLLISACGAKQNKQAVLLQSEVIYGEDDRKEIYSIVDPELLSVAQSTVALIDSSDVQSIPGNDLEMKLIGSNFGSSYNLCATEPFREQQSTAYCSGFLVAPDTIVTAGHCVTSQRSCENTKFVFGFAKDSPQRDPQTVANQDVYSCAKLVHHEQDNYGADFAVIQLDRDVNDRTPLALRRSSQPQNGEELFVIGHPSGLPSKIGSGKVRDNKNGYFTSNLDTYGGNSGSGVMNAENLEVEGILVRGEIDFVYDNGCSRSKVCAENGCRGEDVTDIAVVLPYL